ncbi:trypsin-like serine peptidase [Streptomyces sp. KLOTTS4A1]|uniref:trypsin-like serine peptidase n=1 Tax=Streptomyces sp. KLOTTS4A1 TaxID=3390996 RepID=UPI0039F4AF77
MRRTPTAGRTLGTALGALVSAGALLFAGSATATAAATAAAEPAAGTPSAAVHEQSASAESLASFWTAERMRSAEPLDVLPLGASDLARLGPQSVAKGEKSTVAPTSADRTAVGPTAFPQQGGPWSGGGAVVQTSGRVFFSFDGRTASCSGNAVTSANESTVITAGHCVKYQGSWHTDWVFVPGYHDGQAPHGQWSASQTLTTPQWEASEDMNYDIGAAVVQPLNGSTLTDVVGGQGLQFNGGYNQDMYAFGFPAADPYDGEKLIYCSGATSKDWLFSNDHGMSCNMTGGSSGGPWFAQFDEGSGTGLQASVNSFGYVFWPNRMFGPYFGNEAQSLYQTAQNS